MVGDFPSLDCPLRDMSLESEFSIEPYTQPSECGLLSTIWSGSDWVNSEFIVDYALWCIAARLLGQMDHLQLFWCKEDLILCALG
jgi:hypothetical protein